MVFIIASALKAQMAITTEMGTHKLRMAAGIWFPKLKEIKS